MLIWRRTSIEHVSGAFFSLVLDRIKEQTIKFLEYRKHRFPRHRGPAAEDGSNFFLGQQVACLFGEERPVGSRIDDNRLDLLAEQSALFVHVVDHHQDRVLQGRFADRHRSRQRMQDADLDGAPTLGGRCHRRARNDGCGDCRVPNPLQHLVPPSFTCLGAARRPASVREQDRGQSAPAPQPTACCIATAAGEGRHGA